VLRAAPKSPSLNPETLEKFVDPLPTLPVAKSTSMRAVPGKPGVRVPYYRIPMREFHSKLHRDLPPTRQWGYDSNSPGPTVETRSGQGLLIEWPNELPAKHFLPIDHHLHGAETDKPEVRAVVHVHGAKTPPASDGYPEDWYEPGKSAAYYYPNGQEAATLWYHDHAMGINRLNIYAGMFGFFLIRDDFEDKLNLPKGRYDIPLVIFDRFLLKDGQLDYPVSPVPDAPWVPEVFGNAMLVNGKLFPYLEVEPRRYRFRILNGANGRFFRLSLSNEQPFHQIGTDQGLLAAPVPVTVTTLAPGERADLIIDFSGRQGEQIVLQNQAFAMMQFRVGKSVNADSGALPATLRPIAKIAESLAVKTRELPIYEFKNDVGESTIMLLNGMYWHNPVTENPVLDTVEIWSIVNLTEDTHPIHLHLVRFQILDRRPFDDFEYQNTKRIRYTGDPIPPEPFEAGWKDTVRANGMMVTRIIAKFEGFTGRYVWHCHVLEHEDNDMMRPYEVIAAKR
jgi:spore coat protein A, manganese oxidase